MGPDRSATVRNGYEMDPVVRSYSIMIDLSVFVLVIMIDYCFGYIGLYMYEPPYLMSMVYVGPRWVPWLG